MKLQKVLFIKTTMLSVGKNNLIAEILEIVKNENYSEKKYLHQTLTPF